MLKHLLHKHKDYTEKQSWRKIKNYVLNDLQRDVRDFLMNHISYAINIILSEIEIFYNMKYSSIIRNRKETVTG